MPDLPDFFSDKPQANPPKIKPRGPGWSRLVHQEASIWYKIYDAARRLDREKVLQIIQQCNGDMHRKACIEAAGKYLYQTHLFGGIKDRKPFPRDKAARMLKDILDKELI